jgi:hypothetical protein
MGKSVFLGWLAFDHRRDSLAGICLNSQHQDDQIVAGYSAQ